MLGKAFMNTVANDKGDFLQEFLNILEEHQMSFCIIGGLAVNAYVEPVVSLDLDVVISIDQVDKLIKLLDAQFQVNREAHSINVSNTHSDLRIQIQTDPRYQEFISRSVRKTVLGYTIPVASIEDVLQGKIWAWRAPTRLPSKRQKDLADIVRLIETYPKLVSQLPDSLRKQVSTFLS